MRLANVIRTVYETPWAILPSQLATILSVLRSHAADEHLSDEQIRELVERAREKQGERMGALAAQVEGGGTAGYVAVLPIYGTIVPHADLMSEMSGGTSIDSLRASFKSAMSDDSVKAIVFDVDSPGGTVLGVTELAEEIRAARGRKPIVAQANYLMASAAYWLAAQADEVIVSPSAMVGSIGVYAAHEDLSDRLEREGVDVTLIYAGEHKIDGNPFEPLSDEAKAHMQALVDEQYRLFVSAVAAGRGAKASEVRSGYGQGNVLHASDAVELGLADSIGTLEQTLARVVSQVQQPSRGRLAAFAGAVSLIPLPESVAQNVPASLIADLSQLQRSYVLGSLGQPLWAVDGVSGAPTVLSTITTTVTTTPEPRASDDRREQMQSNDTEETPVDTEATPAAAAQETPELAEMKSVLAELVTAVKGMNEGRVDGSTVEALTAEVETLRRQVDETQPRAGFLPSDVEELVSRRGRRQLGIAELHELPTRAGARLTGMDVEDVEEFHNVSDNLLLLAAATKKSPRELSYFADTYLPVMQAAMDSTTAGEGDEYVPTLLSGNLIDRVELELRVVALFGEINMPSNPYEIPGFGVRTRGGRASEQTAGTGQTGFRKITPATRKITLTAVKFASEVLTSKEAEEDSIIPILDFIRNEVTTQLAHDQEDGLFNGDTAGAHQDNDVTDALDPRKNWEGLRKVANAGAKTDASNAILTDAMLRTNRKKMGKYGVGNGRLVNIISIGQYINLLSGGNVLTVDKYGPAAVILKGELGAIDGIPIVVSEYVREDLNALGVRDGVTTNRSVAATVHRDGFLLGNRRGVTVQLLTELYAEFDQDALTISLRRAFQRRFATADNVVALTFNLAA